MSSSEAMALLHKSPTLSDNDNPAASLDARGAHSPGASLERGANSPGASLDTMGAYSPALDTKRAHSPKASLDSRGAHSRASSSPSPRSGGSSRDKRSVTPISGPVPHGKALRSVVYYQNRFMVIDSTPAATSHTPAHTKTSSATHAKAVDTTPAKPPGTVLDIADKTLSTSAEKIPAKTASAEKIPAKTPSAEKIPAKTPSKLSPTSDTDLPAETPYTVRAKTSSMSLPPSKPPTKTSPQGEGEVLAGGFERGIAETLPTPTKASSARAKIAPTPVKNSSADFPTHSSGLNAPGGDHMTSAVNHGAVGGAIGSGGSSLQVAPADDKSKANLARGALSATGHQMASNVAAAATSPAIAGSAGTGITADDSFRTSQNRPGGNVVSDASGVISAAGGRGKNIMDASSMSVDGRGIEIIVSDETGVTLRPDKPGRFSGKRALLKKIGTVLIDNRMQGKDNCEQLLTEHPEEYRVLKKVLNYMFVTVGVALLVSVFVVILYTCIVQGGCV